MSYPIPMLQTSVFPELLYGKQLSCLSPRWKSCMAIWTILIHIPELRSCLYIQSRRMWENTIKKLSVLLSAQLKLFSGRLWGKWITCYIRKSVRPILIRFTPMHFRSIVWKAKMRWRNKRRSLSSWQSCGMTSILFFGGKPYYFGMKRCWLYPCQEPQKDCFY